MEFLRAACIVIERFSLAVIRRQFPDLRQKTLALVDKISDRSRILSAVLPAGEGIGIEGVTLGKARCQIPNLEPVVASIDYENKVIKVLTNKLLKVSPFVERLQSGLFYLDVSGLNRHYRSEGELAREIRELVAKAGFIAGVGIASNKFVAATAARSAFGGEKVIEAGVEPEFLGQLPISHLPLSSETLASLHDLGLRTIGSLAGYPPNEFSHRFGHEGSLLAQLARGEDVTSFIRLTPESVIVRKINCPEGVTHSMILLRQIFDCLSDICSTHLPSNCGFSSIRFQFRLDGGRRKEFETPLNRPTREAKKIVSQLEQKLSSTKLSAPVKEIVVVFNGFFPLEEIQLSLDHAGKNSGPTATLTQEQLSQYRLYTPKSSSSHLPEKNHGSATGANRTDASDRTPLFPAYSLRSLSGMRIYNPARTTVITSQNGRLHLIKFDHEFRIVTAQKGPWEVSTNWWNKRIDRIYYEITTDQQFVFLVYYDRRNSTWYLQAAYD